ncbi:SAM-dependent methyltransferase [Pseudofrankia sp. DC12]|uniref:SAM-dependent methyltransferase n=1 Tax=Pseudofrankia sp. DC12 TaxID=683315 RepID=UPI001E60A46C|nr:SAM-dependent methyltransferase [Pseudofrankia sp. DC12]
MVFAPGHCVSDDEDLYEVARALSEAIPAGSYLALSHLGIAGTDAPTSGPSPNALTTSSSMPA